VDQSVFLPAGDSQGIERLIRNMTRCPFSLSRLVKVIETGQVVYKAEKQSCRAFPDPNGDGITSGPKRNFQILLPLDFLAEFTQHIPPQGAHLIRYYGHYSNKSRGMRGEGGSGTGRKKSRQAIRRGQPFRCRTDALHEDLGHADQAGVRSGPVIVSSLWLRGWPWWPSSTRHRAT